MWADRVIPVSISISFGFGSRFFFSCLPSWVVGVVRKPKILFSFSINRHSPHTHTHAHTCWRYRFVHVYARAEASSHASFSVNFLSVSYRWSRSLPSQRQRYLRNCTLSVSNQKLYFFNSVEWCFAAYFPFPLPSPAPSSVLSTSLYGFISTSFFLRSLFGWNGIFTLLKYI